MPAADHVHASPRLTIDGLVRRHRGFTLGPITAEVRPGRVCGVLGANGAGKTTLFECIGGQASPYRGSAAWAGRPITPLDWRLRETVSFVRDVPALYDELTVGSMLAFAARVYRTWDNGTAAELLERLELDRRKRVDALSRGMRVKLALLLAVSHEVGLLVLDESTVGLDPTARHQIQVFLRRLALDRGVCVMLSSHLFEDVEQSADEVMMLRDGQVVYRSWLGDATAGRPRTAGGGSTVSLRDLYFEHCGAAR